MSRYNYRRRFSNPVKIGRTAIGGENPIRVQSMTTTSTLDTDASTAQILRIEKAGGELVRLTTQGVKEASNMRRIKDRLFYQGSDVPLVADVHFNPKAAFEAARICDKVRINPGNFADPVHTFRVIDYTDEQYNSEVARIENAMTDFLKVCRENDTAIRLGVNHGSLSDRIMSRYGDTPDGMAESVMEYLRVCKKENFDKVVISVKASNPVVMTETVRLLCRKMEAEDMHYPLHLGVTEAGDGEDARLKSAVGIGSLLLDGIGDTIRVSLSEDPENEIPVANAIRDYVAKRMDHPAIVEPDFEEKEFNPRDLALPLSMFVKVDTKVLIMTDSDKLHKNWHLADASGQPELPSDRYPIILSSSNPNHYGEMASWIDRFIEKGGKNPIILSLKFDTSSESQLFIEAGIEFGALLLAGYGSGILINAPAISEDAKRRLGLGLLQATRIYMSKTEFIACPGCGRTLFDLQSTLKKVKSATSHLKGLKIGVMGCVVNGPGEMADADYGYVGAGPGKVSIYKGKTLMVKNIDEREALESLIQIIKEGGDWKEPEKTNKKTT